MAWVLVFVTCFKGTTLCTTNGKSFASEIACMSDNTKYKVRGTCIKAHVELEMKFPEKK